MSLFICDDCHTIENTALSWYWMRGDGPALCSSCQDAETGERPGKWHDRFDRLVITKANMRRYGPKWQIGDKKTTGYEEIIRGIPPRVKAGAEVVAAAGTEGA